MPEGLSSTLSEILRATRYFAFWQNILLLILIVITFYYAKKTKEIARASRGATEVSERTYREIRDQHRSAQRPHLRFFVFDLANIEDLLKKGNEPMVDGRMILRNAGPGPATDIRLEPSPNVPRLFCTTQHQYDHKSVVGDTPLAWGHSRQVSSLLPGEMVILEFGAGPERLIAEEDLWIRATCNDGLGEEYVATAALSFDTQVRNWVANTSES